jgi:hypothetical protein
MQSESKHPRRTVVLRSEQCNYICAPHAQVMGEAVAQADVAPSVLAAIAVFVYLGRGATRPAMAVSTGWMLALGAASLMMLVCGTLLWKRTRFS